MRKSVEVIATPHIGGGTFNVKIGGRYIEDPDTGEPSVYDLREARSEHEALMMKERWEKAFAYLSGTSGKFL